MSNLATYERNSEKECLLKYLIGVPTYICLISYLNVKKYLMNILSMLRSGPSYQFSTDIKVIGIISAFVTSTRIWSLLCITR